eukprot:11217757-Lingulodinium_polyedra.AAC.1
MSGQPSGPEPQAGSRIETPRASPPTALLGRAASRSTARCTMGTQAYSSSYHTKARQLHSQPAQALRFPVGWESRGGSLLAAARRPTRRGPAEPVAG